MRLLDPNRIRRHAAGGEAGGYGGRCFDRLLIEKTALPPACVESVGSNGSEHPVRAGLQVHEPRQRLDPRLEHLAVLVRFSRHDECLRKPRIGVREALFEPGPLVAPVEFESMPQAVGHRLLEDLNRILVGKCLQVVLGRQDPVGPSPRAGRVEEGGGALLEHRFRHLAPATVLAPIEDRAERPQRTAVRVLRSSFFQPLAAVAHEVSKPAVLGVEGVDDEAQVAALEQGHVRVLAVKVSGKQQRPGVVVHAVALGTVGHREGCVLQDSRIVAEIEQVVEPHIGQGLVRRNRR